MLPIDGEAEKADVVIARLLFVEDAQDRDRRLVLDHRGS
jgi:hypothetical protein